MTTEILLYLSLFVCMLFICNTYHAHPAYYVFICANNYIIIINHNYVCRYFFLHDTYWHAMQNPRIL